MHCRLAAGLAPPEVATRWLRTGKYCVTPQIDMWAFGLLGVTLTDSQIPEKHYNLLHAQEEEGMSPSAAESSSGGMDVEVLQYMAAWGEPGRLPTAYSDLVSFCPFSFP